MRVGVNYPWFDYGWDFGLGPDLWRGARVTPRWYDEIDQHLRHFRDLGITVVRWFILADGLTYGTGDDAPRSDRWAQETWHFDPPALSEDFLQHFRELLERFAPSGIQLLPVLIDFHFCESGFIPVERVDDADRSTLIPDAGWVKQGRAEAITNAASRMRFLDGALEPLLRVCARRAEVIYAWELINEPDWVTDGWHSNPFRRAPVSEVSMRAFLEEGSDRIRRAGFRPTVGFASARSLRRVGIASEVCQFHHYPAGSVTLDPHVVDPEIVGEFATAQTDVWPDLIGAGQSVLNRLRLADAGGYALAIPWAFRSHDRHTVWSPAVEDDLRTFVRESAGHG